MCGYLHRKGTLCGQCVHNYYRAAYSYTFHCIIYCEESQWLLYIVVAYVPLTFFIIFIQNEGGLSKTVRNDLNVTDLSLTS